MRSELGSSRHDGSERRFWSNLLRRHPHRASLAQHTSSPERRGLRTSKSHAAPHDGNTGTHPLFRHVMKAIIACTRRERGLAGDHDHRVANVRILRPWHEQPRSRSTDSSRKRKVTSTPVNHWFRKRAEANTELALAPQRVRSARLSGSEKNRWTSHPNATLRSSIAMYRNGISGRPGCQATMSGMGANTISMCVMYSS